MILDKILGNIRDIEGEIHCHIEKISLEKGCEMKDGDILFNDGHNMVVVSVKEDDVLVITPKDIDEMGEIAHSLGNRHLPVQIENGKIILQYDYVVERLLQESKVDFIRTNMKLKQAFRHVDHSH